MARIITTVLYGFLAILLGKGLLSWARINIKRRLHGCRPPPRYPHKDPILGLDYVLTELKEREEGTSWAGERSRFARLGRTYEVNSWGNRLIMTMDSQNIREVLGTSFDNFGVQEMRMAVSGTFMGTGVFTTDGEYWEYSRKLIAPMFSRSQVSDLSALDVHLDRMFERLPRDGSTVELQGLLKLMYLDHSTELIFGKSTETLLKETPDDSAHELLDTFAAVLKRTGLRIILGRLWIFTAWDITFQKLSANVRAVVMKYIDEAIQRQKQDGKSNNSNRYIIVDELVKILDDREEICNQLLNIFLPVRDAAATGLSGCLFHLARNPDVWDKLRTEVLAIQGPVTRDVLRSMPYMQAVLNESLRLHAPAAGNRRRCTQDCILPTGGGPDGKSPIFISKGDNVHVVFSALHYDKEIWGEDADEFRPERWLDEEGHVKTQSSWTYMPFSAGRRVCPGMDITLTENAYVLVRLMREFERLENRDLVREYVERTRLTTESRQGVLVGLASAQN